MAELHGAVLTGDEGDCLRDRDLDICAEGAEVPIGVADIHLGGVAIYTDALVTPRPIASRTSVLPGRGPWPGPNRMRPDRWVAPPRARVGRGPSRRRRLRAPAFRRRATRDRDPEHAVAPTRVGAVQGQIHLALRQGDWPS